MWPDGAAAFAYLQALGFIFSSASECVWPLQCWPAGLPIQCRPLVATISSWMSIWCWWLHHWVKKWESAWWKRWLHPALVQLQPKGETPKQWVKARRKPQSGRCLKVEKGKLPREKKVPDRRTGSPRQANRKSQIGILAIWGGYRFESFEKLISKY